MRQDDLDRRAAAILQAFDPEHMRDAKIKRPFMIEIFGTPKAGKSTIIGMVKHYFRRKGWSVSTPTEGAEVIELPRDEPQYNFQTGEYALSRARDLSYNPRFHVGVFDRAIFDVVARMQYYRNKDTITPEDQKVIEDYYLLPWNRELFDAHICLVCDPEVAIKRELARALVKKHGKTMNPFTLIDLWQAHNDVWHRLGCAKDPTMYWHDSSNEDQGATARTILDFILRAFSKRMERQG